MGNQGIKRLHPIVACVVAACLIAPIGRASFAQDACHAPDPSEPFTGVTPRLDRLSVDGVPVNVLKPPDYPAPGVRYPVLYLLHGGNPGLEDAWLTNSDLVSATDGLTGSDGVLIVMPRSGPLLGLNFDWQDGSRPGWSFFRNALIPYIDSQYLTRADRAHRAVAGYSAGGYSAAMLAALYPDMIGGVASFSGIVDLFFGAPDAFPQAWTVFSGAYAVVCLGEGGPFPTCPPPDDLCWRARNPVDLAQNLTGVTLDLFTGNGVPCREDIPRITERSHLNYQFLEPLVLRSNESFDQALRRAGVAHNSHFDPCGIHDFRLWDLWLHRWWPTMMLSFGRPAPEAFDFRSSNASFSVWAWTFEADPARAPEFLDVADVSCAGLGVTGSGATRVTTAPCFHGGETVLVDDRPVVADAAGRITFSVDLGPPHNHQQYTPAAKALEAAGGYWVSRTIAFTRRGRP